MYVMFYHCCKKEWELVKEQLQTEKCPECSADVEPYDHYNDGPFIVLTKNPKPQFYSIEAGLADNIRHFDHHRLEHKVYPSPCNNHRIPGVEDGAVIQVSHLDADTFIGVARMLEVEHLIHGELDFDLMEKIDNNGSSVVENDNDTYRFMVGVGVLARKLGFPRMTEEDQDVTEIVMSMLGNSVDFFIQLGKESIEKSEADYVKCQHSVVGDRGLWVVNAEDNFDPSRPYQDGVNVVVLHRVHYGTISIYCNPASEYAYGGTEVGGIEFNGHPKACGSPRGEVFNLDNAVHVLKSL